MDEIDLTRRALAAYFRGGGTQQPTDTRVAQHEGLTYVVVSADADVLAVYRHTNQGQLKRLVRWPNELTTTTQGGPE